MPDPNVKSLDGMPRFTIFTKDFKERKKYTNPAVGFLSIEKIKNTGPNYLDDVNRTNI